MNTLGYEGNVHETATVYSNDPVRNGMKLGIRAIVTAVISVRPGYVFFSGGKDVSRTQVIDIRAGLDKPLTLQADQFTLEDKVRYRIEGMEDGRHHRVHFSSIPGMGGSYRGFLTLKTNYPEKPEIKINIAGRLSESGGRRE
jgi:hypothetical protein